MRNQTIGNLALTGYGDIFNINAEKTYSEYVELIQLTDLHPPEFHPFLVNDDDAMTRLSENIKRSGVLEPGLVRSRADGGYELISGNRRKRACELAGIAAMPVIIRELDDDNAAIAMVDSNLETREKLLLSEKAWAYRVKMEALNHKGVKGDKHSVDVLVEQTGESRNQVFRLIRLTELIITLLDKVDARQLAFNPGVELSYLTQKEQSAVAAAMDKFQVKPSLSQAQLIKKASQDGSLTTHGIESILSEQKKTPEKTTHKFNGYGQFFPQGYTPEQMEAVIVSLLTEWKDRVAV